MGYDLNLDNYVCQRKKHWKIENAPQYKQQLPSAVGFQSSYAESMSKELRKYLEALLEINNGDLLKGLGVCKLGT